MRPLVGRDGLVASARQKMNRPVRRVSKRVTGIEIERKSIVLGRFGKAPCDGRVIRETRIWRDPQRIEIPRRGAFLQTFIEPPEIGETKRVKPPRSRRLWAEFDGPLVSALGTIPIPFV